MAVTAAKSVMAFRVLTMAVDLCRLTTRTMNVNAGHERTSKARIIHQIQLIRGIPLYLLWLLLMPFYFRKECPLNSGYLRDSSSATVREAWCIEPFLAAVTHCPKVPSGTDNREGPSLIES
ncbi:Transposase [Shigella dysenteriae 1617]|uniref:Transposase n=1 Tax=Shigella dysenteriae 1617 TaxID=754093 RepID=A0A0A6ZY50_SHIDY|nr:Transposase [Shigella dysenteriae 1617]